jgi:hypothetical protein
VPCYAISHKAFIFVSSSFILVCMFCTTDINVFISQAVAKPMFHGHDVGVPVGAQLDHVIAVGCTIGFCQ